MVAFQFFGLVYAAYVTVAAPKLRMGALALLTVLTTSTFMFTNDCLNAPMGAYAWSHNHSGTAAVVTGKARGPRGMQRLGARALAGVAACDAGVRWRQAQRARLCVASATRLQRRDLARCSRVAPLASALQKGSFIKNSVFLCLSGLIILDVATVALCMTIGDESAAAAPAAAAEPVTEVEAVEAPAAAEPADAAAAV